MITRTAFKILSSFLIMVLFISSMVTPRTVTAQDPIGGGAGWPKFGAAIADFLGKIPGTESEVMDQVKSFALDVVGKAVATSVLQTLAKEVIGWAASGFEGNPFAVENQQDHMYNIKSDEIVRLYNEVSGKANFGGYDDASAYKPLMNVVRNELQPFTEKIKPTISEMEKIDFKKDFTAGGWDTYIKQADMQNNSIGTSILTLQELGNRVSSKIHTEEQKLLQGAGIQAATKCVEGFISDADTGFEYCKKEVVQTAGKLVGEQIAKAIGSSTDQAAQSSASGDLGSIVSTMLSSLLTDLIYKGLGSIGGNSSAPVDPFASLIALEENDPNFQSTSGKGVNAREVVDINKELNTALFFTKKDLDENIAKSIELITEPILTLTMALDKCVPGPQIRFEDRLAKYFRIQITDYELEKEANEGDKDSVRKLAKIQKGFAEYMGNVENYILTDNLVAVEGRFDGPIQWREQIQDLENHGKTLNGLKNSFNEKQKVLMRLVSMKNGIRTQISSVFPNSILFYDDWEDLLVTEVDPEGNTVFSLDSDDQVILTGTAEDRFNSVVQPMRIDYDNSSFWNTEENGGLPEEEKRRIARLFHQSTTIPIPLGEENGGQLWVPDDNDIRRLALYELFNIPIMVETQDSDIPPNEENAEQWKQNNPYKLNTAEPSPDQKKDAVLADGWKKWEQHMSSTAELQEARIDIIKDLVESRNSYTSERSFDMSLATKTKLLTVQEKLAESLYSCYKASYEVIDKSEIILNRRGLVYPVPIPDAKEVHVRAQIKFSTPPQTPSLITVTKAPGEDDIPALYVKTNWEDSHYLWVEYINNDPNFTIASVPDSIINKTPEVSTYGQNETDNSVTNSGEKTIQISGSYNIIAWDSNTGDFYSEPTTGTISTVPPGLLRLRICARNNEGETCSSDSIVNPVVANTAPQESVIPTQAPVGYLPEYYHPSNLPAGLIWAIPTKLHEWIDAPNVVFIRPILDPVKFMEMTIAEGTPATHTTWFETAMTTHPSGIEQNGYPTYLALKANGTPIPNPVIVVRNYHFDHPSNGKAVLDDFLNLHGCNGRMEGFGKDGVPNATWKPKQNNTTPNFYSLSCRGSEDPKDPKFWYESSSFDYLVTIYPKLKEFVR